MSAFTRWFLFDWARGSASHRQNSAAIRLRRTQQVASHHRQVPGRYLKHLHLRTRSSLRLPGDSLCQLVIIATLIIFQLSWSGNTLLSSTCQPASLNSNKNLSPVPASSYPVAMRVFFKQCGKGAVPCSSERRKCFEVG